MKTPPIALWLWYRGDRFRGFQRQAEGPTVQEAIEGALSEAGLEASPAPSGRTDRGVHARMQVVSFRVRGGAAAEEVRGALEPWLPRGLGIAHAALARPEFHAQWSAVEKEYRYRLQLCGSAAEEWGPFAWAPEQQPRLHAQVAPERLAELLRYAEGTRDFIAFHEKSSVRRPRTLMAAELVELGGGLFEARLRGDGFARYQVRYLVGSAVATAGGKLSEEQWRAALDRGEAIPGFKAPAEGLVLWEVRYPSGVDPFPGELREAAPGVPGEPPFAFRRTVPAGA